MVKLEKSHMKKFRSSRVKSIQIHSSKNIVACGLYNGYIQTWDLLNPRLVNESHVSEFPIRTIKIVENNDCVLIGTDEGKIHIYDLTNLRRLQSFDAHCDFIRKIEIHPSQDEFLTCSDDGSIKRWRLGKDIRNLGTYSGHNHFVMDVKYYPKDTRRFISCSLDGSIKLWDVSQSKPLKTYKGHINGINSICFIPNEEYFVSASDDLSIKVWELSTANCISTLTGHTDNINSLHAHKNKIISTSEDGTVRFWDCKSFQLKETLPFNSGRVWECKIKDSTFVVGTDENLIFMETKTGTTLCTLKNKKVFYVLQNQVFTCKVHEMGDNNYKGSDNNKDYVKGSDVKGSDVKGSDVKGSCQAGSARFSDNNMMDNAQALINTKLLAELDYNPSELVVSENGKSIALVNEGVFTLYSSLGFRKKFSSQGSCLCFISNSEFVVLDGDYLVFYDKTEVVMRLQVEGLTKVIVLNKDNQGSKKTNDTHQLTNNTTNTTLVGIFESSTTFYDKNGKSHGSLPYPLKGIVQCGDYLVGIKESSLVILEGCDLIQEFNYSVGSFHGHKDIFLFSSDGKFYYFLVGDKPYVTLLTSSNGIIAGLEESLLYFVEEGKVKTFSIDLEFMQFQIRTLKDLNTHEDLSIHKDLSTTSVQDSFRLKAISFYESLGLHDKALEICTNENHKYEILLKLNRLNEAYEIADSPLKYERLGRLFMKTNLKKAAECFYKAKDFKSLLFADLLSSKKYLQEVSLNCQKEGYPNYALVACLKSKDYEMCKILLKDSPFLKIFLQSISK